MEYHIPSACKPSIERNEKVGRGGGEYVRRENHSSIYSSRVMEIIQKK